MSLSRTLLIVDDDEDLRELIRMSAEGSGYAVLLAGDGRAARAFVESPSPPDLIVLDISMPGMDGLTFCRWLRDCSPVIPVIFLSARTDEYDKILALEAGGDDYLTKPFSMKELLARVAVSLRRIELYRGLERVATPERVLARDGVEIRPDSWNCSFGGKEVFLTVSEFRILHKLAEQPGRVFSRGQLAKAAFPEDLHNTGRGIDIHVSRIRKKLRMIDPRFSAIETVYQVGYRWR